MNIELQSARLEVPKLLARVNRLYVLILLYKGYSLMSYSERCLRIHIE